jgi:uncharacterized protein YpbB
MEETEASSETSLSDDGETDNSLSPGSKKPHKGDSHRISLRLYKEGVAIPEIATRRGMNATTVESHLASFISTGEIDIKELVPEDKMDRITAAIREIGGSALGPIKSKLGDSCSFGEIRAVMSYLRSTKPVTPFSNSSPD